MIEILKYIGCFISFFIFWIFITVQIGKSCINNHYSFAWKCTYSGNYARPPFYCGLVGQLYGGMILGFILAVALSIRFLVMKG